MAECQIAHTKCTGDGKTCPSENQLAESRVFKWSSQVVQKPLKRCIKRANLYMYMWAAVDFVNQLQILEILAKSLQQSRNRLLLAEAEELLYGDALPLCGHASEDRIILESLASWGVKRNEVGNEVGFSPYRMPFTDWRICVTVTEQSHVFICRWCCILISKVIVGYVFCLKDLLLFYALSGICFRLAQVWLISVRSMIELQPLELFLYVCARIRF